jgi:putative RNA 2'-phosphotransferase
MNQDQQTKLSKLMSYLLRHHPEEAGLTLDAAGMVPLATLVAALRQRPGYGWVNAEAVHEVVAKSDKQRFHIEGDLIGARYGHNRQITEVDPGEPVVPPEILYHGTPRRAVPAILAAGLQPQGRQFVHLSATPETAQNVGQRRDQRPAMLLIRARQAHAAGIAFYAPTPDTYLSKGVPPEYITVSDDGAT